MHILQQWVRVIIFFIQKRMISKCQIMVFLYFHSQKTFTFPFEATFHLQEFKN